MTTDTVPKQLSFEADIGGETVHFGAMIKGAGMIHPNRARCSAILLPMPASLRTL